MLLTHSTSYSVNTITSRSRNHSLNSASKHKLAAEVVVPNKILDKEELIIETLGELLYILAVMAATQGNNNSDDWMLQVPDEVRILGDVSGGCSLVQSSLCGWRKDSTQCGVDVH